MGSYAVLCIGEVHIDSFRSVVPFEALLMFDQADLVISPVEESGDETEEEDQPNIDEKEDLEDDDELTDDHCFQTTVDMARRRMNARGIDVALCRRLYDMFQADSRKMSITTMFEDGRPSTRESDILPGIDFDEYVDSLRGVLDGTAEKTPRNIEYKNGIFQSVWVGSEFNAEAQDHFGDALNLIRIRMLLEIANDTDIVGLDMTDLIDGGYIEGDVSLMIDMYMTYFVQRITVDYLIYGFVIENDPSVNARLRSRIMEMSEEMFIEHVMSPLLEKMGYEHVRREQFHGPGEFGSDILPFRYATPLGTVEYYAVQTKATQIHGTSSRGGNAAEIVSQARQALDTAFVDDVDNERKHIDKFIIATNKNIRANARAYIESAIEANRRIVFLDLDKLVDLVKKHHLTQYILFAKLI